MRRAMVLLALCACEPRPVPPVEPDPPPGPYPVDTSCADVCSHLRDLGCEDAEPTPLENSCEIVCQNVQKSGIVEWDLGCRAKITNCNQVDSCEL